MYIYSKNKIIKEKDKIIFQTDLTPLLAYLLNVPIPSNSIGSFIDLFNDS